MRHLARATLLALCLAAPLGAAFADDTWEKIVPTLDRGEITHLDTLPGGDLLVAGSAALSEPSLTGGWIARFTTAGEEVWSREFIGEAYSQLAQVVVEQDRVYVGGTHMANRTILDGDSVFVAALDHDGGTIWENTLNQPGMSVRGGGIQTLANGDLLVNSTRTTKGSSQWNINYTRLSSDGAVKWTYEARRKGQYYEDLPPLKSDLRTQLGLQDYIELAGPVVEQADSTLHLYFNRSELLAHNVVIGRCEAVTTDGVAIEGQECPVPDQVASLQANDVAPYLVTRLGPGIAYAREINVEKSSENGPTGWKWDFESDRRAGLTDAVLTPDGGLIGVGYTMPHTTLQLKRTRHDYDAVIFRLAPDGTELWSQEYASPTRDIFARIVALGENRYAVGGHTGVNSTTGEWDPWLLIVDGDGKTQSAVPKK